MNIARLLQDGQCFYLVNNRGFWLVSVNISRILKKNLHLVTCIISTAR